MEKLDPYFIEEATDMLLTIEENLLMILEDKTVDKVHTLLRSAHTLKGSSITVGLDTIHTIAHHLEDVFQALYAPELEISPELGSLLFDGYECLRTPLTAILSGSSYDEAEALDRTAAVFAALQEQMGDFFGREAPMMTSEELGFDVVGSIFTDTVPQDLEHLQEAIAIANPEQIQQVLQSEVEFFLTLAQSYSLPGLEEIAKTIAIALEQNPDRILEIAEAAWKNLHSAREAILAGDRDRGGEVSEKLISLANLPQETGTAELITEGTTENNSELEENLGSREITVSSQSETENNSELEENLTTSEITISAESEVENNSDRSEVAIIPTATANNNITTQVAELTTPANPVDRILNSIAIAQPQKSDREFSSFPAQQNNKIETTKALSPTIKVAIERLDNLSHIFSELSIEEDRQNLETDRIYRATREAFKEFLSCQKQIRKIRNSSNLNLLTSPLTTNNGNATENTTIDTCPASQLQFDTLEMDRYSKTDLLLQGLAETVTNLGEKIETIENILQKSRFRNSKRKQLFSSARENLLASRMAPLATVFNRFSRIVQQMIASHKKEAKLQIFGKEVLIDKTICDKLYDPLLHLIRNAYDHGLESPDLREERGKPAIGTITIRAYSQGNRTTIEVKDDGRGLNWEKIRAKAIDRGILSPTEAELINEVELAEVLFEPGFSTADKIGELSGRGVGLDVVSNQLQALDGTISLESIGGEGTTFILQLPLKLTADRLLVCESGGITYALLTQAIKQIILPQPEQIQTQESIIGEGQQLFLLWNKDRNPELIPIINFSDKISYQYPLYYKEKSNLGVKAIAKKDLVSPLLLLEKDGQLLCLQVDLILLEQELVIKTLGDNPTFPRYIQGYSVLGNGSLTLVIDPIESLAELDFNAVSPQVPSFKSLPATAPNQLALQASKEEINFSDRATNQSREMPTILVVEDSIVQRKNVVETLNGAGYNVVQAGNGKEALDRLDRHPEIKLVVCDIEMPLMNGFEFLGQCKQNPRFADIPVLMLTTRSSQKHRQAAFDLGAKDYQIKPYSTQEIIESIANLLARNC